MERDSFVFYRSFFKALQGLPAEEFKETILAVCGYALDGEEPELDGVPFLAFELIRPQINANNNRYASGSRGGRPRKEETEKPMVIENDETEKPMVFENAETEKPMVSENGEAEKPNVNENVNVNERKKGTTYPKKEAAEPQGAQIEEMGFDPELEQAVKDWLRYKTEKREAYKPTGLRSLLSRIRAEAEKHGSKAVADAIGEAMANGWKGIVWERIGGRSPNDRPVKKTGFVNYDQRDTDLDAMLREGNWR